LIWKGLDNGIGSLQCRVYMPGDHLVTTQPSTNIFYRKAQADERGKRSNKLFY